MHGLSACLSLLSSPSLVQVILALGVGLALITLVFRTSSRDQNRVHGPPYVPEQIPYISNTINFMTDAGAFLKQVRYALNSWWYVICKTDVLFQRASRICGK